MTLNELMIRHNFISKVLLKEGDKELSKDLKVKLMSMRIEMGKIRKQFETDLQEVVKGLTPEGYQELASKKDRSKEEEEHLKDLNTKINDEYNAYVNKKGAEEIDSSHFDKTLTQDEYNEILEVNAGNDVEINGSKLNAPDFLEVLYSLFVA
jgi:hypothetical protein